MDGITNSMDMSLGKLREMVKDREAWRDAVHGITKSWTQQRNQTIHISILFSQVIPPSPSPSETKSLFLFLSLLCCLQIGSSEPTFFNPF